MFPATLLFSFGCECEYLWFDSQTASKITFVPFWNILPLLQAENRHDKLLEVFQYLTKIQQSLCLAEDGSDWSGYSLSKVSSSSLSSNKSLVGR